MKKFFNDFKKFISRGNIVDMAVGVIIGSAFSAIVTAFTNKIIMPFINLLLSIGGTNGLETAYTVLKAVYLEDGTLDVALDKIYVPYMKEDFRWTNDEKRFIWQKIIEAGKDLLPNEVIQLLNDYRQKDQ